MRFLPHSFLWFILKFQIRFMAAGGFRARAVNRRIDLLKAIPEKQRTREDLIRLAVYHAYIAENGVSKDGNYRAAVDASYYAGKAGYERAEKRYKALYRAMYRQINVRG